jgi:hypothetical protein
VNPATPFYPAEDATCCPVGNTLLEKLVTDGHLDCSGGRPCVAKTGVGGQGTQLLSIAINAGLTGTVPPEVGLFTKVTNL